jgi:hypothetical protein
MDKSLPSLENLLIESIDRKGYLAAVGIPHPMVQFTENGSLLDIGYADAIVGFIVDTTFGPDSGRYKTAVWFLLESEHAYFTICGRAGIVAEKLRRHLRRQIPSHIPAILGSISPLACYCF